MPHTECGVEECAAYKVLSSRIRCIQNAELKSAFCKECRVQECTMYHNAKFKGAKCTCNGQHSASVIQALTHSLIATLGQLWRAQAVVLNLNQLRLKGL